MVITTTYLTSSKANCTTVHEASVLGAAQWVGLLRRYSNPGYTQDELEEAWAHTRAVYRKPERAQLPNGQLQNRLPQQRQLELVARYQAGASQRTLAQEYTVHRTTVAAVLARAGIEVRPRGLSASQVLVAIELYGDGWSCQRIAVRFKVDPTTLWRALKLQGLRLPDVLVDAGDCRVSDRTVGRY